MVVRSKCIYGSMFKTSLSRDAEEAPTAHPRFCTTLAFLQLRSNTGHKEGPRTHFSKLYDFQLWATQVLIRELKRARWWRRVWFGSNRRTKYALYFQEAGCKAKGCQTDQPRRTNQLEIHRATANIFVIPGEKKKKGRTQRKMKASLRRSGSGMRLLRGNSLQFMAAAHQLAAAIRAGWARLQYPAGKRGRQRAVRGEGMGRKHGVLMTSTDRLWVSIDYWGACYLLAFHIHNEN